MGSLSTFGTFTMARMGIYVSQQALNVTGNNISNINTKGYSRQELDQSAMSVGGADRYQSRFDIRENGGVQARGVEQTRDKYLDIRYRNEQTRVGSMEKKLEGLDKLAVIFDEVGKGEDEEGVLEARFNDFVQQVELLSSQGAGQDDIDSIARKSATALVTQFNDYAKQLATLYETEKMEFNDELDQVNITLTKIRDLNASIRMSEAFGGTALTQKDERNLLIDELSKKIGISVTYEREEIGEGVEVDKLVIKLADDNDPNTEDKVLIDGRFGAQLKLRNETNFDLAITELKDQHENLDPDQPKEAKPGLDLEKSFEHKSAIGTQSTWSNVEKDVKRLYFSTDADAQTYEDELNSYFGYTKDNGPYYHVSHGEETNPALGDHEYVIHFHDTGLVSEYKFADIEVSRQINLNDVEISGGLQAMREMLTEKGEYATDEEVARDPDAGIKRGIPYYQKALDALASTFARIMNEANTQYTTVYETQGVRAKYFDEKGELVDPQPDLGEEPTVPYSSVKYYKDDALTEETTDPNEYTRFTNGVRTLKDGYSYYNGGVLFSNSSDSNSADTITAANISISHDWEHGYVHMLRSTEPDSPSRKNDNLDHFVTLLTHDHDFTNGQKTQGTNRFIGTFQEVLTETIAGTLAKDQNITQTMRDNYNATADELYVDRDAVMGVDLNDEAMNMMQFQKAYAAACRLMTTYDGMLDKLINGTAI